MAKEALSRYIGTFQTKTKQEFGVRFVTKNDTKKISDIMQDVYGYEYLYPKVYDETKLQDSVTDKNQMWILAESIDQYEAAGFGVAEKKNDFSMYVGKLAIKNRFRHQGLARGLGANSFLAMLKNPEFHTIQRIDSDVRVNQYNSMLMAKTLGQFPYAFIPNFNCYGDKRNYHPEDGRPYCDGRLEAAVLYVGPINQFWKVRESKIHLLGNKHILDAYQIVKNTARRMKKDEVSILENSDLEVENCHIAKDYYKGIVIIEGLLKESTLDNILDEFHEWNVVEWRIPTTIDSVNSQHLAIENQFIVSGYDPGSHKEHDSLQDTLVMCKFPRGIDKSQFRGMRLIDSAKPITNCVFDQLSKKKSRQVAVISSFQEKSPRIGTLNKCLRS
ncbi:MAG: hypothetical protein EU530_09415 [Promethearchaeota archaeon]|nr:MAG: hypothetical protein EU530_09415 [Candidatus Lokiarchaeota archaeon]